MATRDQKVSEMMQTEVVSLRESDRLDMAEDVMRLRPARHMPVLDDTRLVGIVTSRDLLAASLSKVLEFGSEQRRTFMHSVDIGEVMTRNVVTVESDATLAEAAELMIRHRIGCLPVVKPDRTLIGLVTETDLLRAAFTRADS